MASRRRANTIRRGADHGAVAAASPQAPSPSALGLLSKPQPRSVCETHDGRRAHAASGTRGRSSAGATSAPAASVVRFVDRGRRAEAEGRHRARQPRGRSIVVARRKLSSPSRRVAAAAPRCNSPRRRRAGNSRDAPWRLAVPPHGALVPSRRQLEGRPQLPRDDARAVRRAQPADLDPGRDPAAPLPAGRRRVPRRQAEARSRSRG